MQVIQRTYTKTKVCSISSFWLSLSLFPRPLLHLSSIHLVLSATFKCTYRCIMYVFLKFYSFLYVLREHRCPRVWINCAFLSFPLSLFLSSFIPPCVCIRVRRIGGMPRITSYERQSTSRRNQVWNKWIRDGGSGSTGSLILRKRTLLLSRKES